MTLPPNIMQDQLATSYGPILVCGALWLLAGFFVVRFLVRHQVTLKQKFFLCLTGVFAMAGLAVFLLGVYASISRPFRAAVQLYALTHPPTVMDDPMINKAGSAWSSVLAGFELADHDGQRTLLLVNKEEKNIFVYAPGYYMSGKLTNGNFVPDLSSKEKTSLRWMLTKNPYNVVSSVK